MNSNYKDKHNILLEINVIRKLFEHYLFKIDQELNCINQTLGKKNRCYECEQCTNGLYKKKEGKIICKKCCINNKNI